MKKITFGGRDTKQGAYTQARVYAPDGSEILPRTEHSGSGRSWEDKFFLEESLTYLVLVEDFSNSGKDNSYSRVEGDGNLSSEQQELLEKFNEQHRKE